MSRWDTTVALMTFAHASWLRWRFTLEILLILKYLFFTAELTCASVHKVASRAAPRFLTVGLGVKITLPIFRRISVKRHCLWELAITIISVLRKEISGKHNKAIEKLQRNLFTLLHIQCSLLNMCTYKTNICAKYVVLISITFLF